MTCPDFNMELAYLVNDEAETASAFPRRASDPDAALVEQLRRRDTEATETLVSTYGDRAYRLAIRITGTRVSLDSVIQAFKQASTAEQIQQDSPCCASDGEAV